MFSPRLLAVLAILATAAAVPATDRPVPEPVTPIYNEDIENPWLNFPIVGDLLSHVWNQFPTFADFGPKIITKDDKFQVVVSTKNYKKEDLKVKVKGDLVFIQGSHEANKDDHEVLARHFLYTYTLSSNSSSADVTAELSSDGKLIVTALVKGPVDRTKEVDRDVPIVETGKPYVEKVDVTTPQLSATNAVEEEIKKEPTTPSENGK